MSNSQIDGSDFKLITYKRKNRICSPISTPNYDTNSQSLTSTPKDVIIRRIEEARLELVSSDLFASAAASLREGLSALNNPTIKEIVCLGLGRIGECLISRYQFAFLLCLKQHCDVARVKVYDPVFTPTELWLFEHYNCTLLGDNCEGKYKVGSNSTTIFYMPHCPKQLTNNLLWSNWGLNLNACIIIANSFNAIINNSLKRAHLNKTAEYVARILPHTLELALINSFKYFEVFNDTGIHVFPWNKLELIADDFWSFGSEPVYSDDDVEFIKRESGTQG